MGSRRTYACAILQQKQHGHERLGKDKWNVPLSVAEERGKPHGVAAAPKPAQQHSECVVPQDPKLVNAEKGDDEETKLRLTSSPFFDCDPVQF
jgi:hypothetical protein